MSFRRKASTRPAHLRTSGRQNDLSSQDQRDVGLGENNSFPPGDSIFDYNEVTEQTQDTTYASGDFSPYNTRSQTLTYQSLPYGINLLKLLGIWPGQAVERAPNLFDVAKVFNIKRVTTVINRVATALDKIFGVGTGAEFTCEKNYGSMPSKTLEDVLQRRGIKWEEGDNCIILSGTVEKVIGYEGPSIQAKDRPSLDRNLQVNPSNSVAASANAELASTSDCLLREPTDLHMGSLGAVPNPASSTPVPQQHQQQYPISYLEKHISRTVSDVGRRADLLKIVREEKLLQGEERQRRLKRKERDSTDGDESPI